MSEKAVSAVQLLVLIVLVLVATSVCTAEDPGFTEELPRAIWLAAQELAAGVVVSAFVFGFFGYNRR